VYVHINITYHGHVCGEAVPSLVLNG